MTQELTDTSAVALPAERWRLLTPALMDPDAWYTPSGTPLRGAVQLLHTGECAVPKAHVRGPGQKTEKP